MHLLNALSLHDNLACTFTALGFIRLQVPPLSRALNKRFVYVYFLFSLVFVVVCTRSSLTQKLVPTAIMRNYLLFPRFCVCSSFFLGGGGIHGRDERHHARYHGNPLRPYLYMQLARFQHRVAGDPGSARTTFRAAVADIPGSRELWLAFLEFEAVQPQVN